MNPESQLSELKTIVNRYSDLTAVIGLLNWDLETFMPPGGSSGRGHQLATMTRIAHETLASDRVGKLLDQLRPYGEQLEPDSDHARFIKVIDRLFKKRSCVPASLMAEIAKISGDSHHVWVQARENADFASFEPCLEKLLSLKRQYADYFQPFDHIYDPLLDDYEPGLLTADVQSIFSALRPRQVELLRAISEQPQVDDSFLHQHYDEHDQWQFGVEVITDFGYNWNHGRQDKAVHPFTQDIGINDVRITTRFLENYFPSAFFSTTHESGHGMYCQGVDPGLDRTPLAKGASLAIHESQSRLYENVIGRSLPFWKNYFPRLKQVFPDQLSVISTKSFYQAINKVEPSLIRVEADEATYNMHIMLRLELEIALVEGSLQVKDLPEAWNACMLDYLGLTPPNDGLGVLQDVHWSQGSFGYFSTYALGNLISAQLWERMLEDIPDAEHHIERGDFAAITSWMGENVHRHGAKFEPQELVQRITGSKIDQEPYLRYLTKKYSDIYQL
jgi:carboxypeptidase Taq